MIQPNSSGLTIPPRVKPVVTIPNARPAAPAGAASADQHIARGRDHAAEESRGCHRRGQQQRRHSDGRDDKHDGRVESKADGGDLSVAAGCGRRESRRPVRRIALAPRNAVSAILADENDAP